MLQGSELKTALQSAGYDWAAHSLGHPRDFGYYGDLDLFNTWGLCYALEHRDSNTLDQSNSAYIQDQIKARGLSESFEVLHFGHWGVGWIDQLAIKLVDDNGELNKPALDFMQEIHDSLESYAILDEEDYCRREYEDFISTLENYYKWDLENAGAVLPDGWAYDMYSAMDNISSSDELSESYVMQTARELGYIPVESEDE
jgi:hypothetical protein